MPTPKRGYLRRLRPMCGKGPARSSGRWVLDQRVRIAADAACDELNAVDPPSGKSGGAAYADCRSLALRRAEPEVRRALRAAG